MTGVEINIPGEGYRTRFRTPQLLIDDGTSTDLDAKGDGIKSLVAIALMRASRAGRVAGDLVVAIEEPEAHLHPGAVRELALVLQDIANEHQVVITTHSPLMASRSRIASNIIVSDRKVMAADSIERVRRSLGVEVHDNLSSAAHVVLVEGRTDITTLAAIFKSRSSQFRELTQSGRIVFDHLEGASKIVYKVQTLIAQVVTPIIIVDADSAGRASIKQLGGQVPVRQLFLLDRGAEFPETELEDLLDPQAYWHAVESEFGATLDIGPFVSSRFKWSTRMKAAFRGAGKPWTSSVESNLKLRVASLVATAPASALAAQHESLVDSVITSIASIVDGR